MNKPILYGLVFILLAGAVFAVDANSNQGGDTFVGFIVLLPMILGFFFLKGAQFLGDDHQVLKIFLFLFSILSYFISMWMGTVALAQFYNTVGFDSLQDAIGTSVLIFGIGYFMILAYFILYGIWQIVDYINEKKEAKLRLD